MSMNRFGIRLAAGLAVITLGCLGIFQAQRGSETVVEEPWDEATAAAAIEPPTPLQLEGDPSAPTDLENPDSGDPAMLVRGNDAAAGENGAASGPSSDFGFAAFDNPSSNPPSAVAPAVARPDPAAAGPASAGAIQLAAHDEPADEPAAGPATGFAFPQPLSPAGSESELVAEAQPAEAGVDANGDSEASEAGGNGVTISAIDDRPVGSSLQMPQPLSAGPANELESQSPPQELAELEPLEPQPLEPQPLEPQSSGQPASEAAASETEPAEMASSEFQFGPTAVTGDVVTSDGGPSDEESEPAPQADDFTASSEAAAAAGISPEEPAAAESNAAAPTAVELSGGPQGFAAPRSAAAISPSELRSSPLDMAAPAPAMSQPALSTPLASSQGGGGSMQTVDPSEILAEPGERRLEGAQTPSIVIHKRAPEEVRVGKPSDFIIQVKNVGTVAALDVRVFDSVPQGMQLVEVVPQAAETDGLLCWQLGDLEPGGERTVTMKLIPEVEGELGSVARVTFEAAASVRTIATRPQLKLVQRAPEQVLIGQQLEIEVELSNVGSGTAAGVMLQADLAEGLQHPMGRQLDNLIGSMPPGDARRQILRLRATAPGRIQNTIRLMGEDGVTAESTVDIEVISPALEVALSGPSLRYLERQTTYNVQVANSGTANASEVDIVAYLDRGLKFVSTEFEGQYDPSRHAVFWSLAELPAGQSGEVPLTLLPVEAGTHNVRLEAKADLGIAAASEKSLAIETLAELSFSIADDQDPIETGTETTYEIRVQNTGSRDDSNVQLKVQLPAGMELISADPQAGTDGQGLVVFQPIARIEAKGEQVYRVRVRGQSADTHLIQAILVSEQSPKPVTKEESTTVYSDR